MAWDVTDNCEVLFTHEDFFSAIDFTKDRSEEVRKVETNE